MDNEEIIGTTAATDVSDKPFKSGVSYFKCWQAKMKIFLTLKNVVHVLTEDILVAPSGSTELTNGKTNVDSYGTLNSYELDSSAKGKAGDLQLRKEIAIWKDNDYIFKNHILNSLPDDLYDYYSNCKIAKQVWEALQKKYDTKEAGAKKYVVSCYLNYKMVDERSVEAQSHGIQKISHEIITEGMPIDEQF